MRFYKGFIFAAACDITEIKLGDGMKTNTKVTKKTRLQKVTLVDNGQALVHVHHGSPFFKDKNAAEFLFTFSPTLVHLLPH